MDRSRILAFICGVDINWLDFVLLTFMVVGALAGWRVGLFGAIFSALGILLGVFLAGRFSGLVAEQLTESVSSETLATVISYGGILVIVFVVCQIARSIVKKLFSLVFLGSVDTLGGLVLGLTAGVILAGGFVTVLARSSVDLPNSRQSQVILEPLQVRKALDTSLQGSQIVPLFLDLTDALPADSLGFLPDDLNAALDLLRDRIGEVKE